MENKNIVATMYIKNGMSVKSAEDFTNPRDSISIAKQFDDSGIDKIIIFDLSEDEKEQKVNLATIKEINKQIDVKTCGGGNIDSITDIKNFLYAGCIEVVLNGSKPKTQELLIEASAKIGHEKLLVSLSNVNFLFKAKNVLSGNVHELLIMDHGMLLSLENMTDIPYILIQDSYDFEEICTVLKSAQIRGIYGQFINDFAFDVMTLKGNLSDLGIKMDNFEKALSWSDLKLNSEGLIPVVVQDYQTDQVLMLAYMDEDAFNTTIRIGKMTYHSRSRNELWTKGLTSGHLQYVKSLTADCDYDTLLAKVSQVGGIACHTGSPSCFFNEIIKKEYTERNPVKVLEKEYEELIKIKESGIDDTREGELFNAGLNGILKTIGSEIVDMIIAANDENTDFTKQEIADFISNVMMLMVEKNLTWEDITRELTQRS